MKEIKFFIGIYKRVEVVYNYKEPIHKRIHKRYIF